MTFWRCKSSKWFES